MFPILNLACLAAGSLRRSGGFGQSNVTDYAYSEMNVIAAQVSATSNEQITFAAGLSCLLLTYVI